MQVDYDAEHVLLYPKSGRQAGLSAIAAQQALSVEDPRLLGKSGF